VMEVRGLNIFTAATSVPRIRQQILLILLTSLTIRYVSLPVLLTNLFVMSLSQDSLYLKHCCSYVAVYKAYVGLLNS
jgi:hypothetical protein